MYNTHLQWILINKIHVDQQAKIKVSGTSMYPTLSPGDTITIERFSSYEPGDILVFMYKEGHLLVHRLLKKDDKRYFCKGDNSLRLEDIEFRQIVGKVTEINNNPIPPCLERLITLSFLVSRAFHKSRYDSDKTKQTNIYKLYEKIVLQKKNDILVYQRNPKLQYISLDGQIVEVIDTETGNKLIFDRKESAVLNALETPCDLHMLFDILGIIDDETQSNLQTKEDIKYFLHNALDRNVVVVL